jgi:hypothetical protein
VHRTLNGVKVVRVWYNYSVTATCAISHGSELACWLELGGVSAPNLYCIVTTPDQKKYSTPRATLIATFDMTTEAHVLPAQEEGVSLCRVLSLCVLSFTKFRLHGCVW